MCIYCLFAQHKYADDMNRLGILALFFPFRVFVSVTHRTVESPDEWWQSEEVAYSIVFNKGHLPWEWHAAIRSVVFPLIYALPMWMLKCLKLDTALSVWLAGRITQACIAFGIDYCVIQLCARIDDAVAKDRLSEKRANSSWHKTCTEHSVTPDGRTTLLRKTQRQFHWFAGSVSSVVVPLMFTQWYYVLEATRSYSNVAEALLILVAVLQKKTSSFLLVAALACCIRVTCFFSLLAVFCMHLYRHFCEHRSFAGLFHCLLMALTVSVFTITLLMCADYLMYRRWIFVAWRFFVFNVVEDISSLYGSHFFLWNFVCGLPIILGPHVLLLMLLLPVALSTRHSGPRTRKLVGRLSALVVWVLLSNSMVAHKEVRFIFPAVPLCLVLLSFAISTFAGATMRTACSTDIDRNCREETIEQSAQYSKPCSQSASHGSKHRHGADTNSTDLLDGSLESGGSVSIGSIIDDNFAGTGVTRGVRTAHALFIFVNVVMVYLAGYYHRQGGLGIAAVLRNSPIVYDTVDVMAPCYFSPGYSHFHGKVHNFFFLDCPPLINPVTRERQPTYDSLFHADSVQFIQWLYNRTLPSTMDDYTHVTWWKIATLFMPITEKPRSLPNILVLSVQDAEQLKDSFLSKLNYTRLHTIFHSHNLLNEDWTKEIQLWRRSP